MASLTLLLSFFSKETASEDPKLLPLCSSQCLPTRTNLFSVVCEKKNKLNTFHFSSRKSLNASQFQARACSEYKNKKITNVWYL